MSSNDPQNIATLTGLRAFAALWVVALHLYSALFKEILPFLYPLAASGANGVEIFFVLSGFILSYLYKEKFNVGNLKHNYKIFIFNRLARIYPLHLICLIYVSIFLYFTGNNYSNNNWICSFLYNIF